MNNKNYKQRAKSSDYTIETANGNTTGITVTAGTKVDLVWTNKSTDIFTYYKAVSGGKITEDSLDKSGGVKTVYPTETTAYTFMAVSTSGIDEKSITVTVR